MKIVVNYDEDETVKLAIDSAEYLSDYILKIKFSDGYESFVDFGPFLLRSLHPSIKKYLLINKFKNFEIENGNLNWNNYELIFPVSDLYSGKI
jgi:hypothetical protein